MHHFSRNFTRRDFLAAFAAGVPALIAYKEEALRWVEDGDFLQELTRTSPLTEGPFYPDRLPLDTDNDLIVIAKSTTPAVGEITHLTGIVKNAKGDPIKNAIVEIWQVDNHGAYLHSGSANKDKEDKNFQGFGRFETASDGAYKFRTIKPVAYPGRAPHIHMKVLKGTRELITTQCHVKGDPRNSLDGVLNGVRDAKQRESVIVAFDPVKDSKLGELQARFDIVLGFTPTE